MRSRVGWVSLGAWHITVSWGQLNAIFERKIAFAAERRGGGTVMKGCRALTDAEVHLLQQSFGGVYGVRDSGPLSARGEDRLSDLRITGVAGRRCLAARAHRRCHHRGAAVHEAEERGAHGGRPPRRASGVADLGSHSSGQIRPRSRRRRLCFKAVRGRIRRSRRSKPGRSSMRRW